jgi:hypothetical protein
MNELELSQFYSDLEDLLDNYDEIVENHDVNMKSNDDLADIADHMEQVRIIISGE